MKDSNGDNGLGTVEEVVIQYSEVEGGDTGGDTGAEQSSAEPSQESYSQPDVSEQPTGDDIPNDVNGLMQTVHNLRAELQRKEEYTKFLRESIDSGAITPQQAQQAQNQFDLDDDVVPFAGDVKKMIDAKVEQRLAAMKMELMEETAREQLQSLANEARAKDPEFDKRMDMAVDLLRDPAYASAFNRLPLSGKARLDFLEKIAPFHPNYSAAAPRNSMAQDTIDKLKANSLVPPTLASMGSQGSTMKSINDMTEEEFEAHYNNVLKQG